MRPIQSAACLLALYAGALVPAAGQSAAPPAAKPEAAQQAVPESEVTVVTVLGKLSKKPSSQIRRLSRSASSCAYSFTAGAEALVDAHLDHFHGRGRDATDNSPQVASDDPEAADQTAARAQDRSFSDTSPAGDAKTGPLARPSGTSADGTSVQCGQSDLNFAAGRNAIARNDKTLDRAYEAYNAGDFPKALAAFKQSYSRIGYDEAALRVGDMYLNGQGTARDVKEAIAWYTRAAADRQKDEHFSPFDPKNPHAATARVETQLRLAGLYMAGVDVPRDPAAARRWHAEANTLNHIPSRHVLGRFLVEGYGGAKDVAKGMKLITAAAEYGYAPAQWQLATLYDAGTAAPRDARQAFAWYQQAAFNPTPDRHKPYAQLALARMYEAGDGTAADLPKAVRLYKAAAVAGHPDAQNALATFLYAGNLLKQDLPVARKLFIAAASQGNADAMTNAGVMLFKGEGGGADPVQSYVWLRLAQRLGSSQAPAMADLVEKHLTAAQREQAQVVIKPKAKS